MKKVPPDALARALNAKPLDVDAVLYALEAAFGYSRKEIAQAVLNYAFEGGEEEDESKST